MALDIGSRIAHYDVTALIGEGGMGQVYQTNNLTRRRFLCGALSVFGVVAGARPLVGKSQDSGVRQEALGLLQRQPAFDLHTHPGSFYRKGFDTYGGDRAVVDQFQDMVAGRLAGGFCSIVADIKILAIGPDGIRVSRAFETGEAWADYLRQATALRELVALAPARLATGPSDLPPRPGPEVAAFIAVEGGDCLEGRVSRVEELYRDGVRSVQLVHYAQNDVGDLQTADPVYDGLSPFGHQVVAEMERVGMVVDVAHASFQTVRDVAEQTNHPLVLSHSQLQTEANRHPRLITPDHASLVAATGGVIGMWPAGFGTASFSDFVENTLRLVDVVGIDHVGLGTDMDSNYMPVFDNYGQLLDWTAALLEAGLTAEETGKLLGGNAHRVLTRVLTD